ncbi:hypothetical protein SADUNF_Sadunf18G0043100 [Salix dunnii]|uniref:DNA2/NAM7 helicase-like C-terminal domain-containing protein n=1 Tax=Salix dunnii TaxID=1413687 RepID=A0A835MG53_9ROSI|nr:hypothetical protein SADUNF_Sadunf18G0043100 [Salix dunnii]
MSKKLASFHEIEVLGPYLFYDIMDGQELRADSSSFMNGLSSSSIGFVADVRRMNVALTRAKLSLWILGNTRILQTNQNWAALVKDAKERNLVISAK